MLKFDCFHIAKNTDQTYRFVNKCLLAIAFAFICSGLAAQQIQQITQKPTTGFIENKGQIHDQNYQPNPAVKYLLTLNNGLNVQLKANSFSYDTYIIERTKREKREEEPEMLRHPFDSMDDYDITWHFHRVDIELVGANPSPEIIAEYPSEDYLNYYNTVTPEEGATFVRSYQKVTYKNIYAGIDLEFEARAGTAKPVEYNFIIHPGADASLIRIKYNGANETKLTEQKISVSVAHGSFYESIPLSHLKETNEKVEVNYLKFSENEFGFMVPEYDKNEVLMIDPLPVLDWGTYYGGNLIDYGWAINVYNNEIVLVTGLAQSSSAIATSGSYQDSFGGNYDAFIVKFSSSGNRLWGTYFGGSNSDEGYGIATDQNGYIFVTGVTSSSSAIATNSVHQATYGGLRDAFIVKFNSSGQRQWGTYYGGDRYDSGLDIACDLKGNLFVTGNTESTSDIATSLSHQPKHGGTEDAFIVKFNTSGLMQWGTYYGGSSNDIGIGITNDQNGNLFVTGYTESTSAIATTGAHQTAYGGGRDAFVVKFNTVGIRLWGTYYGGNRLDQGWGIATDQDKNVFVTGYTASSSAISTSGAHQSTYGGAEDAFIVKFNTSGQRQWGTYYGGSSYDRGFGITSDQNGNIYITGCTESTSAIATPGAHQTILGGYGQDAFIARFNSSGQKLWGTYYGGKNSSGELARRIVSDNIGNVFVIGETHSDSAIATPGAHQTIFGGDADAFVAKFIGCYRSFDTLKIFICDSFDFNGKMLYVSGTYHDTFLNYQFCDSIITLFLTINKAPITRFFISDSIQCYKNNYFIFTDSSAVDAGSIVGYLWEFGDGDTSTLRNPIHSYKTTDTFDVKLLVTSSFGCKDSIYKTVIVHPTPEPAFYFNDSNQCLLGNYVQLSNASTLSSGTLTYLWDFGDGDTSTAINGQHRFLNPDTFLITLYAFSQLNCMDSLSRQAVVYPMPQAAFSVDDSAQCLRGNLFPFTNHSAISSGTLSYRWDFGDGDSSALTNPSHSYSFYDTLSVRLIATSSELCPDTTFRFVIIQPMPQADYFIWDTSQCFERNAFGFTNRSSIPFGTMDYFWRFGDGGTSTLTDPVYSYTYPDTFDVHLLATSANGCKDSTWGKVYIHVHPEPVSAFSIDDSAQCLSGNIFSFQNNSTISSGNFTQTWYFGDGDTLHNLDASHSYSLFDTLKVRLLVVSDWLCKDSVEKTVIIHPMPQTDFVVDTNSLCYNENIFHFTNKSSIPYGSVDHVLWDFGDMQTSTQQNPVHIYTYVDTFPVKLLITSANHCKDSLTKEVMVRPMPVANFDITDSSQCLTDNLFEFQNQSTVYYGSMDFRWDFGDSDSSFVENPDHSYGWFDTFGVRLIANTNHHCKDTFYRLALVHPMPLGDFSIADSDQCLRDNLYEFTNLSTIPYGTLHYNWDFGDDSISSLKNPDHSYLTDDTYSVKLLAISDQNCRDSIEKQLIVRPMPLASFTLNDSTQCFKGNRFEFTNTTSIRYGSMTYRWRIENDTLTPLHLPPRTFKKWGRYPVQLIAESDKGCTDTFNENLIVYPMPVSAFIFFNNCLEDTMWFFDSSFADSGIVMQWYWDFKNGKTSTLQNPYTIFYDTGQKSVTLTSTTDFGCSNDTTRYFVIEAHVTAPPLQRATVVDNNYILIEWDKPLAGILKSYTLERSEDGFFWETLSEKDRTARSYEDFNVRVGEKSYTYRLNATDSCEYTGDYSNIGKSIHLTADTSEQFPVLIWTPYEFWQAGVESYELQVKGWGDFQTLIEIPNSAFPIPYSEISQIDSFFSVTGKDYCYRVIAYRSGDSLQSVSNEVCIPIAFRLFVPNAFSPNEDGINDLFMPVGIFIKDYNMQIYNRWGEKIFESNDIHQGWDGKYKNDYCPAGVYVYQIVVRTAEGKNKKVTGSVHLLR